MADQLGQPCPEHAKPGLDCCCDERRDREAGVHRAGSVGNMFGGYDCVCGAPWLDTVGCMDAPRTVRG